MACTSVSSSIRHNLFSPSSRLSTSPHPSHRIAYAAFKALDRLEMATTTLSGHAPPSFLEECDAFDLPNEKLLALKIIQAGVKKHELSHQLGRPISCLEECNQSIEDKMRTIAARNISLRPIQALEYLIRTLAPQTKLFGETPPDLEEISDRCRNHLQQIHSEFYGLHLQPEKIVQLHKIPPESITNPTLHIQKILQTLVTLRKRIQECRYTYNNPIEQSARANYIACLQALSDYLATQVESIHPEMLEELNPEIPELVEMLWAAEDSLPESPQGRAFTQLKKNVLYGRFATSTSTSEDKLNEQISWIKNHKHELTKWLDSGYRITTEREQEIISSIDFYEQYLRRLELQKADTIMRRYCV